MTPVEEIYLHAPSPDGVSFVNRLRPIIRRLLSPPGLARLRALARRALAVTEPSGHLTYRRAPARQPRAERHPVTVLTANLWHDWPRFRRLPQRMEAFASLIEAEDVDVVLMQEVARTPDLRADEWLGARLKMAYVYSRANGHQEAIGFEEGLAVFSRFPLLAPHLRDLGSTAAPFTRRLALGATLDTPWGELSAFSVHLSLFRGQNAAQFAHLQRWVGEVTGERPALIGGDFNAPETTPQIAGAQRTWRDLFRQLHPGADGATHTIRCGVNGRTLRRARLDYLFLRPDARRWRVLDARPVEPPADYHSDHRPVLARLVPESALLPDLGALS